MSPPAYYCSAIRWVVPHVPDSSPVFRAEKDYTHEIKELNDRISALEQATNCFEAASEQACKDATAAEARVKELERELLETNTIIGGVQEIILLYRDNESSLQPIEALEEIAELVCE